MKRRVLYLAGVQVVFLVVIGWLWKENRSLRQGPAAESSGHGADLRAGDAPAGRVEESRADPERPQVRWLRAPRRSQGGNPAPLPGPGKDGATGDTPRGGRAVAPPDEAGERDAGLAFIPGVSDAHSLLRNGGFDRELAPWTCEEGKIAPDPDSPGNSFLEITPENGGFLLGQTFRRTAAKQHLVLSFRVKSEGGQGDFPGYLGIYLYDKEGRLFLSTCEKIGDTADWSSVTLDLRWDRPDRREHLAHSLEIEGRSGRKLWIDDVRLVEAPAPVPRLVGAR